MNQIVSVSVLTNKRTQTQSLDNKEHLCINLLYTLKKRYTQKCEIVDQKLEETSKDILTNFLFDSFINQSFILCLDIGSDQKLTVLRFFLVYSKCQRRSWTVRSTIKWEWLKMCLVKLEKCYNWVNKKVTSRKVIFSGPLIML